MASSRTAIAELDNMLLSGLNESEALQAVIKNHPEQVGMVSDYLLSVHGIGREAVDADEGSDVSAAFDSIAAKIAGRMKPKTKFRGISAHAKDIDLTLADIAQRLNVGISVLSRMDGRLISLPTIPERFIEALARELKAQASSIAEYLAGRPTLVSGNEYKSRREPKVPTRQEPFESAIKTSVRAREMTEADADVWLSLDGEKP